MSIIDNNINETKEEYAAMIMERHYLGDDNFMFTPHHLVIGEYFEDEKVFRDKNGNKFFTINDEKSLTSEIPYIFTMCEKLTNLKHTLKMKQPVPMKELISEYEWYCKQFIYYAGYLEDGRNFFRVLSLKDLKTDVEKSYSFIEEEPDLPEIVEVKDEETDEEVVTKPLTDKAENVILDIIARKYNMEELRKLREKVKENKEEYEDVIDAIDLQIETLEDEKKAAESKKFLDDYMDLIAIRSHTKTLPIIKKNVPTEPREKPANPYKEKIDIEEVFKKVTKTLIAQDEAARRLITELARKEIDDRKKREGILLTGATGVGKTKLIDLIAENIDKPLLKVDTTQLTVPGYVGEDIEQVLYRLYKKCGEDKAKTERAIIYFDEIDKKGSEKKSDVSGQGVLNVLLPFIEGSEYDATDDTKHSKDTVRIKTDNMTVIFGGAFTDVYKNLKKENEIGFTGEQTSLSKPTYRKAEAKDFVEHGLMTNEFMGRVTVIKLNDLDLEDIKRVLLESDQSQIRIQQEIFEKIGVKLTFTDGYSDAVAKRAYEKKTGARALNGIIDESTWRAFDEVYCSNGEYEEVILTEETVEDNTKYQLVKKKDKK